MKWIKVDPYVHFSKTQNVKAREIIKDKRWSASFWKKQEIFLQPKSKNHEKGMRTMLMVQVLHTVRVHIEPMQCFT